MNEPATPDVPGPTRMVADADLARFAEIAEELGDATTALEARQEAARLVDGRFYVACVGQFKRGKSTLINALIARDVLPVGVIPVTAVVTIVRFGDPAAGVVTFADGRREAIDLTEVADFVDERRNPGNGRGAFVVEILVPVPILHGGLCLVDTPGISSVHAANTIATRAFVPHIDVGFVVVGPDPPISHDELELVGQLDGETRRLVVVLNKADQMSAAQRTEIVEFTQKTVEARLGHPLERLFVVSARERLEGHAATRDWQPLVEYLVHLTGESSAALMAASSQRACRRIGQRLLAEIQEHESALRLPIAAIRQRVERLRAMLTNLDQSLAELRFLFDAAEATLSTAFEGRRASFLDETQPALEERLDQWVRRRADEPALRGAALAEARRLAEEAVNAWIAQVEPVAEELYEEATARLVTGANTFLANVSADATDAALDDVRQLGFQSRRQFYFTGLMHVGSPRVLGALLDRVVSAQTRRSRVAHAAQAYLTRLLHSNSHRVANDLKERVRESRRQLEGLIRRSLVAAVSSAERALALANERQTMEEDQVRGRLVRLDQLKVDVARLAMRPMGFA